MKIFKGSTRAYCLLKDVYNPIASINSKKEIIELDTNKKTGYYIERVGTRIKRSAIFYDPDRKDSSLK